VILRATSGSCLAIEVNKLFNRTAERAADEFLHYAILCTDLRPFLDQYYFECEGVNRHQLFRRFIVALWLRMTAKRSWADDLVNAYK
jgi:hypothetical protein